MSLPIEFYTENTDEPIVQQPKIALNLMQANYEDSDSEELEIEMMASKSPMSQYHFEPTMNLIVKDDETSSCAEKKTLASVQSVQDSSKTLSQPTKKLNLFKIATNDEIMID